MAVRQRITYFIASRATAEPLDPELYEQVKREAKRRFKVWPSAYASGWLVKTYRERGGRYRSTT